MNRLERKSQEGDIRPLFSCSRRLRPLVAFRMVNERLAPVRCGARPIGSGAMARAGLQIAPDGFRPIRRYTGITFRSGPWRTVCKPLARYSLASPRRNPGLKAKRAFASLALFRLKGNTDAPFASEFSLKKISSNIRTGRLVWLWSNGPRQYRPTRSHTKTRFSDVFASKFILLFPGNRGLARGFARGFVRG
jgi:hypothetical protein